LSAITNAGQGGGVASNPVVAELTQRIVQLQSSIDSNREKFEAITAQINAGLSLCKADVLREFSRVSGISASKLGEDGMVVLRRLKTDLLSRVFGQDTSVEKIANAIRVARVGKRNRDKPQAAFMLLGPSGVGKTEIAKALAQSLTGDEKSLLRFDMAEYMEKHAVAKLIGAPPGYEGFEAGGILTNAMRKNRNRIILFDEIEKAHPDVFNIFLSVLSDGRLTDNVGRTVSFDESIIIMTTNIGQPAFLNPDLTWDEAQAEAIVELNATYRAEFLNRFAGRQNILCFSRLDVPVIEKIVRREITDLDRSYQGDGVRVTISDADLAAFVQAHYDPRIGARGLPGYIQAKLEPIIADQIIDHPGVEGVFEIGYDNDNGQFTSNFAGSPQAQAA
ncbi:MAG: ATP-dependent Clp protease ATP-binding subunit, partial [Verrucomicrobiaceae bacterium]